MDEVSFECGIDLYHNISQDICWRKYVLLPMLLNSIVHIHLTQDERKVEILLQLPSFDPNHKYESLHLVHHGRNVILGKVYSYNIGS